MTSIALTNISRLCLAFIMYRSLGGVKRFASQMVTKPRARQQPKDGKTSYSICGGNKPFVS